jgi:hypothetical protein
MKTLIQQTLWVAESIKAKWLGKLRKIDNSKGMKMLAVIFEVKLGYNELGYSQQTFLISFFQSQIHPDFDQLPVITNLFGRS